MEKYLKKLELSENLTLQESIDAFEIFYDSDIKLAKKFSLRGIPTSILINKDGYEFAKVIGSIDFEDPKFVNWLLNYD